MEITIFEFDRSEVLGLQIAVADQMTFFADAVVQLAQLGEDPKADKTIAQAGSLLNSYTALLSKLDIYESNLVSTWEMMRATISNHAYVEYEVEEDVQNDIAEVVEIKEKRKEKEKKKKGKR
jgi:hypothetical protein